jgi:hypothetical protein
MSSFLASNKKQPANAGWKCGWFSYALENHYIGIGVTAEIDGEPKVLLPEDWVKWEWFDADNIPTNLFPATKNLIDCYLQEKVNVAK